MRHVLSAKQGEEKIIKNELRTKPLSIEKEKTKSNRVMCEFNLGYFGSLFAAQQIE